MGLMFSYALTPAVDLMSRWRLPRPAAAALLLILILSTIGWGGYTLRDDANGLIESLPEAARKLKESVRSPRNQPESNFDKMQQAAAQLEQASAESDAARSPAARGVARVQIEKPAFNIKDYVVVGGLRLAEMLAQFIVVCVIAYFLLASGDVFRRKLVRIAGPTFAKRKLTVQALNEITEQIQRYLVVQLLTSAGVGVATAAAFWMIGMKHAAVWGVAAAVLNLVPYLGSIALCGLSAVVALTQFGTLEQALLVASVSVGVHIVSGYLVAPWLTGRTSRLSAVVVFVGVLAWGWLWGVWGLLLGAPMLMAIKAVCDRVDDLKPIGELLGGIEIAKVAPSECDSEQTSDPEPRNMQA
jgi:predicted PurR-regulated permease PerM